jgi:hypothetical protein
VTVGLQMTHDPGPASELVDEGDVLAEIAILDQLPQPLPIRLPISEDRLWMRPADDEVQGVGLITTDLPA